MSHKQLQKKIQLLDDDISLLKMTIEEQLQNINSVVKFSLSSRFVRLSAFLVGFMSTKIFHLPLLSKLFYISKRWGKRIIWMNILQFITAKTSALTYDKLKLPLKNFHTTGE